MKYRYKPILIVSIDTSSSDASIGNIDILISVLPITRRHFRVTSSTKPFGVGLVLENNTILSGPVAHSYGPD